MKHLALRRAVIAAARAMNAAGLNQGTSGNVAARTPEGFLVTPTGMAYDMLKPGDIVAMSLKGEVAPGQRKPSSEWRIHRDIFAARPEAGAVIHSHAMFATTLACLGRGIPAVHYMVAVAGGEDIRCAPYATFGSAKLSRHALKALDGRKACLLANHGMVAFGADLDEAFRVAIEVETLAAIYWRALQAGKPRLLSKSEMARVVRKFRRYGQQD